MLEGIKNGWDLFRESLKVFYYHPQFLIPLLLVWSIYAPIILYLKYFLNPDLYTTKQLLLIVLMVIFLFAFLISFSCSMLLELIEQLETGKTVSLIESLRSTLGQNLLKILPLVVIWTVIWFLLLCLQAFFSRGKKGEQEEFTAENAARTLAGSRSFSLSAEFFRSLNKGVRMIMFLILPAIAWENLGFRTALRRGFAIFKAHLWEFVAGFVFTEGATMIIFLPPFLLFFISGQMDAHFSDFVWYLVILYIAFAWSYSIYLEQMFTAGLYIWHLKWEENIELAQKEGRPIPSMEDIPMPSLLDEVPELLKNSSIALVKNGGDYKQ